MASQEFARHALWNVIAERDFTQLHEAVWLDVDRLTRLQSRQPQVGRRRVSAQSTVVVVIGQVDAVTALSPVEETGERDGTEMEVIAESHLVVRQRVTGESDDLVGRRAGAGGRQRDAAADERLDDGRRLAFLNEHVSERGAEGADARIEGRHREARDLALRARIRGRRLPVEATHLDRSQIESDFGAVRAQLAAVDVLRREPGRRSQRSLQQQVVNRLLELGELESGAPVGEREIHSAFDLVGDFGLDFIRAFDRREACAADAFVEDRRGEREPTSGREVSGATVSDAQLEVTDRRWYPRRAKRRRELRVSVELGLVSVVARALSVDAGGEEEALRPRQEFLLNEVGEV